MLTSGYPELALAVDGADEHRPHLLPGGVTDSVAGRDFYRSIMETLERFGGYHRTQPGTPLPAGQRSYYVFSYDWRQDLQQTAAELSRFLARIRHDHRSPKLGVDVIAHSMGGLVTRYFVRYGAAYVINSNELQPTMAGAEFVRRVILLGTPNLGSMKRSRRSRLAGGSGCRPFDPRCSPPCRACFSCCLMPCTSGCWPKTERPSAWTSSTCPPGAIGGGVSSTRGFGSVFVPGYCTEAMRMRTSRPSNSASKCSWNGRDDSSGR